MFYVFKIQIIHFFTNFLKIVNLNTNFVDLFILIKQNVYNTGMCGIFSPSKIKAIKKLNVAPQALFVSAQHYQSFQNYPFNLHE